jgi:hypothetical protein
MPLMMFARTTISQMMNETVTVVGRPDRVVPDMLAPSAAIASSDLTVNVQP